jgi:putative membrane protein
VVTRVRAFDPQVFLEFMCYAVFAVLTLYLVFSGKYLTYVTPRMAPYLYFSSIVMLIWSGASVFRLFRPRNRVRVAHCFVPAIPILLILLPHSPLSAADLSYNYAGGDAFSGAAKPAAAISREQMPANDAEGAATSDLAVSYSEIGAGIDIADVGARPPDAVPVDGLVADVYDDISSPGLVAADAEDAVIEVGDDEFYSWLNELYTNLEMYEGRRIAMTGFVFKDPEVFGADEFVPARLGMTCCVADLVPYGLVCKYDGADGLAADEWLRVEGVIQIGMYEGMEEPQIAVTSVSSAEEVEGYIYPFGY